MKYGVPSGTLMLLAMAALFTANAARQSQAPATGGAGETGTQEPAKPSATASPKGSKRKIPCKTPENASLCYWTHGRLRVYNGNPSDRIWQIGTRRILGVFSGPSHFPPRTIADNENPDLPAKLESAYDADYHLWKQSNRNKDYEFPIIFADLDVCPLRQEITGGINAGCIEAAQNSFIETTHKRPQ